MAFRLRWTAHTPPLTCKQPTHPTNETRAAAPDKGIIKDVLSRAVVAELVGCALFQVVGGCAPAHYAAAANGLGLTAMSECGTLCVCCCCVRACVRVLVHPTCTRHCFSAACLCTHTYNNNTPLTLDKRKKKTQKTSVYAFGNTSGAHLNPAVSLMLFLKGQTNAVKTLAYMVAQVAGCVLGAWLCTQIVPGVAAGAGLGAPGTFAPAAGLSCMAVAAWEGLMTFMLCTVVYSAAVAKPGFGTAAPLGIGLSVAVGIMVRVFFVFVFVLSLSLALVITTRHRTRHPPPKTKQIRLPAR